MPDLPEPYPGEVLAVDSDAFREVLGHFASGVTIITSASDDGPVGFSCQSFASLSLDPPLVAFAAGNGSTSWPRIRRTGRFCVNILSEHQAALCRLFATSGADKFGDVRWRPTPGGCPLLEGVLAWVDCRLETETEAGDHAIVIGRVTDLGITGSGRPLLFFRGDFGRLDA